MGSPERRVVIILGDNYNAEVYHSLRNCLTSAGINVTVAATHFLTSSPDIRFELEVNGVQYLNEPVWVDGSFISGRLLEDLPAFFQVLVDEILFKPAA